MFSTLSQRIDKAVKNLKGKGRITEINVATTVKEIRRALVDADVNYKVAKQVTDEIKEEALGRKVLINVEPGQLLVKIVHEKLTALMGGEEEEINIEGDPAVVLMSGLQGSGKTTFSGKLANFINKKRNKKVLLVACDVYRPAAINQLQVVGEQIGVEVYAEPENKNPVSISQNAIKYAKENNHKVVIVDTAGRLAVDEEMMKEIEDVKNAIKPSETLFVVDSMTGQDAVNTAKTFNERINFDGVVLTKLDGDTRGGAALSIRAVVNKPIKFTGTGEKMDAINVFRPEGMAGRILDMGDIVDLVRRTEDMFEKEEMERLNRKMRKNQFDYDDFLSQLQQIKNMGNLKDLIGMLPGMNKVLRDVDIDENSFKPIEAIIRSMTPHERQNPAVLKEGSRRKRIANGSGTSIQQVNNLIKQFEDMRKMMKKMNKMTKGGKRGFANLNPFG
ncbi:signal recognition particle protein [Microscilla marina]|uniref:Signal recognition particle protein n=1 Tax=Microscilla marina ATCC 23134 TaxID=313606 RepID=A1ZRX0_MICM2|nr:signal recognition particle protein [Microscilla marina]EAY26858.1 signal recognition particle protein [Microscilla marina ATCC 23134]